MACAPGEEIPTTHGGHCAEQHQGDWVQMPVESGEDKHRPGGWPECRQEIDPEDNGEKSQVLHVVTLLVSAFGNRGLGMFKELLLGSVSEYRVRHVKGGVVVVLRMEWRPDSFRRLQVRFKGGRSVAHGPAMMMWNGLSTSRAKVRLTVF